MTAGRGAPAGRSRWGWEFGFFDTARWRPRVLWYRYLDWVSATARRRWTARVLTAVFLLLVLPLVIGAIATAHAGDTLLAESSSGGNVGLDWMTVEDSSGVRLSDYLFATNHGSLLHPGNTVVSTIIVLEFQGWLVIVTGSIWLTGYTLSFAWLNLFSEPLEGVAHSLSGQIATPMLMLLAVTIGTFFVGWFIVRGFHTKATMQVVAMLLVAVLGPVVLAEPLADVLSPHGLLAKGRDIGLSVAAGLNGERIPDPSALVSRLQTDMADNFARRPLQTWNFGHVVDNNAACKAQWNSGIRSGDDEAVIAGMKDCGDGVAHDSADNPSGGQIGAGLILLLAGAVLLLFAVYLSLKVIKAALDTVYHGLMSIFGFAAGGFVYGPTQTFLVRNVVDGFISAARMACYTIFLGVYLLFLGDLFDQAKGNVMAIFVIGAIVEVIAIFQLRKLSHGLTSANEFVANRFALALQGVGGGSGGGGSGGGSSTALGMGQMGAGNSMTGLGLLAALGAISTVSTSPATEWLFGGTRTPLSPMARMEKRANRGNFGVWGSEGFGGARGMYYQSYAKWPQLGDAARRAALGHGGIDTARGAASALQAMMDSGALLGDARGGFVSAGFTDERIMSEAIRSWGITAANADDWTLADKHLGGVVAAARRAQESSRKLVIGEGDEYEVAADMSTLQAAAFRMRRDNPGHVTLDDGQPGGRQLRYVDDYMRNPTQLKLQNLQKVVAGETPSTGALQGIEQDDAARMLQWIGNEHALRIHTAVGRLMTNPADPEGIREVRRELSRAGDSDSWGSENRRTPWNSLQPPGTSRPLPYWAAGLSGIQGRLR